MLVEFTEFNSRQIIYVDHCAVTVIRPLANSDSGSELQLSYDRNCVLHVRNSPYEAAEKINAAEKQVESY